MHYFSFDSRDFDTAIQHYKEALTFHPDDDDALCALAKLYLMTDDLDQCQYTCMTLLRKDKENEEATVMMADLGWYILRKQISIILKEDQNI